MKKNIFLTGFMGTGKTTVSRQLGKLLKYQETDTDVAIEQQQKMSVSDIFSVYGEAYFRDLETTLLKEFRQKTGMIISCGGGIVLRPENVRYMKECGMVVLLTAEPETVYERVRHAKSRPLLKDHMTVEYIKELMAQRKAYYEKAADFVVATDRKSPQEIAEEIIKGVTAEVKKSENEENVKKL